MKVKELVNVDVTRDEKAAPVELAKTPPHFSIDDIGSGAGLNNTALDHYEPSDESIKLTSEIRNSRNK